MNDGWADCWKRWDRTTMLGQCSTSSSSLIDSQPAERETQQVIPSTLSNWCWINALICRPFWSDSWERQMDSLENVPQEIHIYESKVMESCPVLDNYWIKPKKIKDYASVWTIEMKGKKWYHSETRTSLEGIYTVWRKMADSDRKLVTLGEMMRTEKSQIIECTCWTFLLRHSLPLYVCTWCIYTVSA